MRARVAVLVLSGLLAACSSDWDSSRNHAGMSMQAQGGISSPQSIKTTDAGRAFAALPDRGNLLSYDRARPVKRSGPYTWHPVELSEAHALNAVVDGEMVVTSPEGRPIRLRYERHIEHADGNWTWIGRDQQGSDAVLTFGEKAVFGSIPDGDNEALQLTVAGGRSWFVQTDRAKVAQVDTSRPDYLIPPDLSRALSAKTPLMAGLGAELLEADLSAPVDVLLGYTAGFAIGLGGQSQAVTRLNNLVDITNEAYANSAITQRLRLVHAMQVDFPDATDNGDALQKVSGYQAGVGPVPVDPAFNALRAARDQYGADVVSLVRKFQTPQNNGCGIAWLIGGGQAGIDASSAPFGYSVVSDGMDVNEGDGLTYSCRQETLAHELGHNMGQAHNAEDTTTAGAHPYSYGYRETSTAGFYTVMAYRLPNSSQTPIRHFANPYIAYRDRPTGIPDVADNVRSMVQTMPIIAAFRASTQPTPALYAITKLGGSGYTEIHMLNGADGYKTFIAQIPTALGQTGNSPLWQFAFHDLNRDGAPDLYAILRQSGSGRTEIHVLDGARHYQVPLLQVATILGTTGAGLEWEFLLGDYNRDGAMDLYTIYKIGASGRTEVHVLNGANGFQTYLAHIATGLGQTGADNIWQFELADHNTDGILDLYCIFREGGSNRTEVHVLNGAGDFQTPLLQVATALQRTGGGNEWDFKLGDYNRDGVVDLYTIFKPGASGKTEVHVLDGASRFGLFSAHIATALVATGSDYSVDFELTQR